jgi:hypothetical protein
MNVDPTYPPFQIACKKCFAEVGEPCGRWEGAPYACSERTALAEAAFGKWKYRLGRYENA